MPYTATVISITVAMLNTCEGNRSDLKKWHKVVYHDTGEHSHTLCMREAILHRGKLQSVPTQKIESICAICDRIHTSVDL